MKTEDARIKFKEAGLSYSDLGSKEMAKLREILEQELSEFRNESFQMALKPTRKKDSRFGKDGSVEHFSFRVKGWIAGDSPYFTDREAITFNTGGFIGFAGWSDSTNVTPFLKAFDKWVNSLINLKF